MVSVTFTVEDKQRGPKSEKTGKYGPWKIAATSGVTYKAWDDAAKDLQLGKTYDCRVEVTTRGEYTDTFIKHAVLAKEQGAFPGDDPGTARPSRNGPEHGMMVKESFLQLMRNHPNPTPASIADSWVVAEEIYERVKNPGVDQYPSPERADFPTDDTF